MDAYEFIKKTEEPIAFILARYFTSDLGVLRSLNKKNIPTIVLNPNNKSITCFSRYYKGIICPRVKNDGEQYINFLLNLGEKLNTKGVLLSVGDSELAVIFKNKTKLEKHYAFLPVDFNIIDKLLNKKRFSETVDALNIPHSETYFLTDEAELESISKEITYPCIIKPIYSDSFRFEFKTKLFLSDQKRS